jgi:hypothetical protein
VKKVRNAFYEHYQIAGSSAFSLKKGMKPGALVRTNTGKLRMVATQW